MRKSDENESAKDGHRERGKWASAVTGRERLH